LTVLFFIYCEQNQRVFPFLSLEAFRQKDGGFLAVTKHRANSDFRPVLVPMQSGLTSMAY
jgi:hypothetical protein